MKWYRVKATAEWLIQAEDEVEAERIASETAPGYLMMESVEPDGKSDEDL